jgi:hypothetical protein
MDKYQQARSCGTVDGERTQDHPKNRGEVTEGSFHGAQFRVENWKDSLGRGKKSPALESAGAVGDMIRGEAIKDFVYLQNPFGIAVGGSHEWKRRKAELPEACFAKAGETLAVPRFAMVPRGLQSVGVSEAAGREGGIGQLPDEPFI